jgi:peptide chain release factor subunit 1
MRKNVVEIKCNSCGHEYTKTIGRVSALPPCPECKKDGDNLEELDSTSLIDEFSLLAAKARSEVYFISLDTEEGAQLHSGFGGLAAVLRYPI